MQRFRSAKLKARQYRLAVCPNCPTCGNLILSAHNCRFFLAGVQCLDCDKAHRHTVLPQFVAMMERAQESLDRHRAESAPYYAKLMRRAALRHQRKLAAQKPDAERPVSV